MKLTSIFKWKERKQLYSNVVSLSFMQATNYIIPLVAVPYLIRVMGNERFGLVMFVQVFMQYFMILVDFGFELTATREISIHRNDKRKMSEIFYGVMTVKAFLLLGSLIVMSGVVYSFDQFRAEWKLYFLSFGMVVGQMLFPIWFFQGTERMRYVMYFNLLAKTLFTGLVFVTIHHPEDYRMYAVVNSAGYMLAGVVSLIVASQMDLLSFVAPSRHAMVALLRKSRDVFISNVGGSLYMTSTPFVLGVVTGRTELVGYYTVAEKVVRGIRYSITPVTQALFPFLSKRFLGEHPRDSIRVLFKILIYLTPLLIVLVLLVNVFAKQFVFVLTGGVNPSTIVCMRILSVLLLAGTYNNVFGVLGMLNLGMESQFRNSVLLCGVFNIFGSIIGSYFLLDVGASLSMILTDTFLALLLFNLIQKKFKNA